MTLNSPKLGGSKDRIGANQDHTSVYAKYHRFQVGVFIDCSKRQILKVVSISPPQCTTHRVQMMLQYATYENRISNALKCLMEGSKCTATSESLQSLVFAFGRESKPSAYVVFPSTLPNACTSGQCFPTSSLESTKYFAVLPSVYAQHMNLGTMPENVDIRTLRKDNWLYVLGYKMPEWGLIFPIPNLLQEMLHVDLFSFHFNHPGVFEHAPWCCSARTVFLEAT